MTAVVSSDSSYPAPSLPTVVITRPPGRSTRSASARAAAESAGFSRCSSHTIVMTSADARRSGRRVTSPSAIRPGSRAAATAAIPDDRSSPATERPGPASRTVTIPVPQPTSTIRTAAAPIWARAAPIPAAAAPVPVRTVSSVSIASAAAWARASPPLVAS